ncbi:5665_t:CDS:2, partial [Dentiscutata erythropus]
MPPPNKRKRQLEAARKSKVERAHLKKSKTMHKDNDLLDYELVDEELDDHIWVDEEIDEKADSYFEVLLAAARNNNTWKIVGRPTYNYTTDAAVQLMETNLVDEAIDTIVIDEYGDTIIVDTIEELDNMLEKNSKQVDKGTKVRLQAALQYLHLRYQSWTKINSSATIAGSLGWGAYKT